MTLTSKLILTVGLALAVMTSTSSALVQTSEAAPVAAASLDDDIIDYEQYESPPIWTGAVKRDDPSLPEPIQFRRDGARGGDSSRHHMGRRGNQPQQPHKRAVIFDKNPHLTIMNDFKARKASVGGVASLHIEEEAPTLQFGGRRGDARPLSKRGEEDDEEEGEEDEGQDTYDLESDNFFRISADGDLDAEVEVPEVNGSVEALFENLEGDDEVQGDFEDDDEVDEEEEEEEEEDEEQNEEELDEERRLDNEAGLQDWIEEMKSEEYFDLAGHPDGDKESFENGHDVQSYDEDEPSPSEEEIFAASWDH